MENLSRNITIIASSHTEQIASIFVQECCSEILCASIISYLAERNPDCLSIMSAAARRELVRLQGRIGSGDMEATLFDRIRNEVARHLPLATGGADLSPV